MRSRFTAIFLSCGSAIAVSFSAWSQTAFGPDKMAQHMMDNWPVDRPVPVTNLEDAYRYQDRVVELLTSTYGVKAGYKAALTSTSMQKRFKYDRPVLGVVLQDMLLRDRVILDDTFAVRPMIEADLMVMIKDESINEAETDEELLAAIEGFHPLIELPDLVFAQGTDIQPLWLTAINAGAKFAVAGDPSLVTDDPVWLGRMTNIQATVMDKQGQVIASGKSDRLLGNPLNVIRWIRDEVASRGGALKKGEVLWLGSLTDPMPVVAGESYQVLYTGLNEYPVSIQVNIRKTTKP